MSPVSLTIYVSIKSLDLNMVDRVAVQLLRLVLGTSLTTSVFDNPALPPV